MALFATKTAWFSSSVSKDIVQKFGNNGGTVSKSVHRANLCFGWDRNAEDLKNLFSQNVRVFDADWVTKSLDGGKLVALGKFVLAPPTVSDAHTAVPAAASPAKKGQSPLKKGGEPGNGALTPTKRVRTAEEGNEVSKRKQPKRTLYTPVKEGRAPASPTRRATAVPAVVPVEKRAAIRRIEHPCNAVDLHSLPRTVIPAQIEPFLGQVEIDIKEKEEVAEA